MKTQKTIVIEDEEEEEDLEFMEQQKLLMDIQHEKEVEEENKFQALCSSKLLIYVNILYKQLIKPKLF